MNAIDPSKQEPSLNEVLSDSQRAQSMVQQCADELSTVNANIQQQMNGHTPTAGMQQALQRNEEIEDKVQQASDTLVQVNDGLAVQILDRSQLDQQLAIAIEQEERARRAALHDGLTGLPNRVLLGDRLEHGLAQARRHGWTLAVLFMDLDGFKQINDCHGHVAGDQVLKWVAQQLLEHSRIDDTVSRYGGDEFLFVLMQVVDAEQVAKFVEKIGEALHQPCEIDIDGEAVRLQLSSSIGIAMHPRDGETPVALLLAADQAMYRAKRGKLGYAFA